LEPTSRRPQLFNPLEIDKKQYHPSLARQERVGFRAGEGEVGAPWMHRPQPNLVFGGNLEDTANLTWVTHEQHAQLVVWWNKEYRRRKK
jgi:hypothetical protein